MRFLFIKTMYPIKKIFLILFILLIIGLTFIYSKTPSNDRNWDKEFTHTTNITSVGDEYTLKNIRDFTYMATSTNVAWTDMTLSSGDIVGASFFVTYFSPRKEVAHTFISFELKDGSTISLSIEARREAGEKYTFIDGFLNTYELQYLWGTERDFVTERVVKDKNPVYMYKLALSPESSRALFRSFAEETVILNEKPRFYHLLFANCTNMLAKITNKYYPGKLPYDISWNLTGLSPEYLIRQGYMAQEMSDSARTLLAKENVSAFTASSPLEYSQKLRETLGK